MLEGIVCADIGESTLDRANMSRLALACGCALLSACGKDVMPSRPTAQVRARGTAAVTGPAYDVSYDAAGRLSSVSTPTGESAQYVYDPTGNILEIRRFLAGTLSIFDFQPSSGGIGQVITVTGQGFNSTPASNTVVLNGLACTVVSATSAQLTFAVPAGATSGLISVTNGTLSATSSTPFTVTDPTIAISDFNPKLGKLGTVVTIAGKGFDPQPINDRVFIGRALAPVNSPATASSLQVAVPAAASSGKVRVSSPLGTAVSAGDFFNLPGGYLATDIGATSRIQIGVSGTIPVTPAGKVSLAIFDGGGGQGLTAYITNVTLAGSTGFSLYGPDGTPLVSSTISSPGPTKIDLGLLPATGTYTIAVQPGPVSGSLDIRLILDDTGTLAVNGAAGSFSLGTAQNGRYAFTVNPNDALGFGISALAMTPAGGAMLFQILGPDQGLGSSLWAYGPASAQLPSLAFGGTYTLRVIPGGASGTAAATFTVLLSRPLTGTLALDGPATTFQTMRVGQTGRYTFSGTANQGLTLQATAGASFPSGVQVTVYKPDGTSLVGTTLSSNGDSKLDLAPLPATGTYTVVVQPSATDTGMVSLRLVSEATGTLAVDGAASSLSLGAAQNGRYTLTGNVTVNDLIGLGVTALGLTPAGGSLQFILVRPDGTNHWVNSVTGPTSLQIPALPIAGAFALRVIPPGTGAATFTVLLSRPLTGALALDGPATTFQTTRAGQTGRYTFSGTAGQSLTMQATAGASFPSGVQVTVYRPDSYQLATTTLSTNGDTAKLDLAPLPATGTYTVVVQPSGTDTGTVSLRLVSEATGTLAVDGAASSLSLGTAQNGRYTLSAVNVNDLVGVGVTALGLTPAGGFLQFILVRPDGTNHWVNSVTGPTSLQVPALPIAGTYALRVIPSGTAAATFTVLLSRPLTGTLTVDGAASSFQTTRAGQTGRYTFSGTAGQNLTMQATAGASFLSGVQVTVYRPDSYQLATTTLSTNGDTAKLDLAPLPATGTYTVVVQPSGTDTGTVSLRLMSDATGTLTIGGPASSIVLGTAQNGRYTFAGTINDVLTLNVQALVTSPQGGAVTFALYRPDGAAHWVGSAAAPTVFALPTLPQTGTYMLRIVPSQALGANLTLLLSR
jgi:YD repeat-containing protein